MSSPSIEVRRTDTPIARLGLTGIDLPVSSIPLAALANPHLEHQAGELRLADGLLVQNRLLSALPAEACALVEPHLENVWLTPRGVLFDAGEPLTHVYFPATAVVSLVDQLRDGGDVEVATVGSEGIVGLPLVLGEHVSPLRASCQIAGSAKRLTTKQLSRLMRMPEQHRALLRYAHAFMAQLSQTAACNRAHLVEERCARWILTTHDRIAEDELALTHELLAATLGVRRAGVTLAVRGLQEAGMVRSGRGTIAILDRSRLERVSCECYQTLRDRYARLMPTRA